jgi:hypothetical protein
MVKWRMFTWMALLLPLIGLLVACGGGGVEERPFSPEGPALIMFYTDD